MTISFNSHTSLARTPEITLSPLPQSPENNLLASHENPDSESPISQQSEQISSQNQGPVNCLLLIHRPIIPIYVEDLVQQAKNNQLPGISGRDTVINQIIRGLLTRDHSNIVISGAPDSGKKWTIYGLAQKIASNNVPNRLLNLKIIDIHASIKRNHQFREAVFFSIFQSKEILLINDSLFSEVSHQEYYQALSQLDDRISKNLGKVIIVTNVWNKTSSLFEKYQTKFLHIELQEPSLEETQEMVASQIPIYENFHTCRFGPDIALKIAKTIKLQSNIYPQNTTVRKTSLLLDLIGSEAEMKAESSNETIVTNEDVQNLIKSIETPTKGHSNLYL